LDVPIVRRIDHVVIRVAEPAYGRLLHLLAGTLQLPAPRRLPASSSYRRSSIYAGNMDFEILCGPPPRAGPPAHFYGLVLETQAQDLSRLAGRGISYIPAPCYLPRSDKAPMLLRLNVLLEGFLGATPTMRLLFTLNRLVPERFWMRTLARNEHDEIRGANLLYDRVYRHGLVMLVKYNPGWRAADAERRRSIADFIARRGGALGLVSVKEVVIGAANLRLAGARWRNLLHPAAENGAAAWHISEGAAIRLVAAERDAIHHLVWEVESLEETAQVLHDLGLLGSMRGDEIRLDRQALFGLDIRLVEASLPAQPKPESGATPPRDEVK
jgi:hypothetical protein